MKKLESKQLSDRMFLNIKSRNLFPNSDNRYHNLMMTPDGWFKNQLDFKKHFFFNIRIFPDSFSHEWHSMHSDSKYSREEHTQFFFFSILLYIFLLRQFVRLRQIRSFLYRFARLVLRWFTVISILYYSNVFLAVN